MVDTTRRALIERYKDGPPVVADALAGATDAHPARASGRRDRSSTTWPTAR